MKAQKAILIFLVIPLFSIGQNKVVKVFLESGVQAQEYLVKKGQLKRLIFFHKSGDDLVGDTTTFFYDESNILRKSVTNRFHAKALMETDYIYDEKGRIKTKSTYVVKRDGKRVHEKFHVIDFSFSKNGRVEFCEIWHNDNKWKNIFEYDGNGNVGKTISRREEGPPGVMEFEYDLSKERLHFEPWFALDSRPNPYVVKKVADKSVDGEIYYVQEYGFEYDDHGRLLKKKYFSDGKMTGVLEYQYFSFLDKCMDD